jgi:predicted DCC family thiol-disulfide oxidoreductase YuxK
MMPTNTPRDATASGAAHRPPERWLILYDGDCGFCRWSLAHVLALDRRRLLAAVELGSRAAGALLADLSAEQRAGSWHLIAPDGRRYSAGAALAPLLALLPAGRIPARAIGSAPGLTDRAYRWVAANRSKLSRAIPASAKRRAVARIERHSRP